MPRRKNPLVLLNARLSEKSAAGYGRFPGLTRDCLKQLTAIAAQTEDDAERLTKLGAPEVSVMGNLKFDIEPPAAMLELGAQLRATVGHGQACFSGGQHAGRRRSVAAGRPRANAMCPDCLR